MTVETARRRLPPDQRREQIVDSAERLFSERPYAQVSTTEIAREAGVARGLLNHYFGDKRTLYLEVVRRAVLLTGQDEYVAPRGSLRARVEASVAWYLDSIEPHRATYLTVSGATGLGEDADVTALLDDAADVAARRVLDMVGVDPEDEAARAAIRAYGGLVRATIREWTGTGALAREEAHVLLREALIAIVRRVLPELRTK